MITTVKQFTESFKFGIELIKPETKDELNNLIIKTTSRYGNGCDLNFIDTSLITDMTWLFSETYFNGNISKWNVSNVTTMQYMFYDSYFDGDISKWDISNVTNMDSMFMDSKFTKNIDGWDINPTCNTTDMFYNCKLEYQDKLPKWYKK